MIIGDFNRWEEEKGLYSGALAEMLELLRTADLEEMEDGVYPIRGDGTVLILKRVVTAPFGTVWPERHDRFIDIHYLLSGREKIGFARDTAGNEPAAEVHPPVEDHWFFSRVERESEFVLYPGQFAVLMPSDIHRPWCTADAAVPAVRKALVKLPVSALRLHE